MRGEQAPSPPPPLMELNGREAAIHDVAEENLGDPTAFAHGLGSSSLLPSCCCFAHYYAEMVLPLPAQNIKTHDQALTCVWNT
jgi:hypothetical protein